jgi:hypothetical protein
MLTVVVLSVLMQNVIMPGVNMLKVMATARDDLIYNNLIIKKRFDCHLYFLVGEAHSSQWQWLSGRSIALSFQVRRFESRATCARAPMLSISHVFTFLIFKCSL